MRTGTVSYKLEDLKKGVIIPIGFVGENDFTRVIFDAEEIYKKYPSASVSMKVQPPKGVIYPAAVTRDGNTVIWQVKEADVANRGGGELQLTFIDGETKIKTYIAKTDVKRSLAGNGPAPDPIQDFVDNANEKLAEVDDALEDLAAMDNIAKTAQASDIGKALSPKTVENGVVTEWEYITPGGGTEDYTDLDNKPSIAGVTLSGNKTLEDLGIAAADDLDNLADDVTDVKTAIHGVDESVSGKADNIYIDTDAVYNHSNLLRPTKATIIGDSIAFGNMKVANEINMSPNMGSRESSSKSVTYTQNGMFLILNGTASGNGGNAFLQNENIPELPAGDYKLYVFIDKGTSTFATSPNTELFYTVGSKTINKNLTSTSHVFSFSLSSAASKVSINVSVKSGNAYNGYKIWFGLFTDNVTITDLGETVESGSTYEYDLDGSITKLCTMLHTSTVKTAVKTDVLIDIKTDKKAPYVTPEEYGALGDGAADDYSAIISAIAEGISSRRIILCARKYKITETIVISSQANIQINELNYTGTDEAIKVQGRNNKIEIRQITSSGVGMSVSSDGSSSVQENHIIIGKITAAKDGIVLNPVSYAIFNNRIEFMDITAGGNSYYCITKGTGSQFMTENTFRGGHCHNAHYAVRAIGGNCKLENFYVEDNIKGGFLNCGQVTIINDRHWECCNASDEPFLKFTSPDSATYVDGITAIKYESNINLPINHIDVSNVSKTYNNGNNTIKSDQGIGVINCPIGPWTGTGGTGVGYNENPLAMKAYLFADAVILIPMREFVSQVTDDLDIRSITKTTQPLPTTFVVDTADVNINLHASYCWIGINKFVVSQRNGYTAKIYEFFNDNCVFDGENLGNGDFEIECYTESKFVYADGRNMKWRYRKLSDEYVNVI